MADQAPKKNTGSGRKPAPKPGRDKFPIGKPEFPKRVAPPKGKGTPGGEDGLGGGFQMGRAFKTSLGWMAIVLVAFLLASVFSTESRIKTATFTELQSYIADGQVESAVISGNEFTGKFRVAVDETDFSGQKHTYREFHTILPFIDTDLVAGWQAAGFRFEFKESSPSWFDYLWSAWPIVLIVFFWFFIMRRMQGGVGGQGGLFNFGKSKAKLISPEMSKINFSDVAGADEAKNELEEIIEFLKNPGKFSRLGGKVPKGALLLGPPGTGKTLLARAVAGEANVPFFSLSGADFVEMFVGVGASRVRDLFEQGKKCAPAIIFIDEIDAVGRHRGAGLGGGHDEREQTLNQLLVEMDGFETDTGVILIASTNRPDVLDKALLRPGRFDRQIMVDVPDRKGREGILKVHTKRIPLGKDVDLSILARGTPGLVGADLANLVNEAALLAARYDRKRVGMQDIEEAKDKIMMGVERKSLIIPEDERKRTAYHEAGHAIVAYHTDEADPLHKITIIPRGRALGITAQLPVDDRHSYTRTYIYGRLDILMGGRIAEKIVYNELTTGAGNDIDVATDLARRMVVEWGMSDKVGPTSLGKASQELFLGREIQQHTGVSEDTARAIDNEIKAIILAAEARAKKMLTGYKDELHLLAGALLKHETIHGEDIPRLFEGQPLLKISKNGGKPASPKLAPKRPRKRKPAAAKAGTKPKLKAAQLKSESKKN